MRGELIKLVVWRALVLLILIATACDNRAPSGRILYDFESESDLDRMNWHCRMRYSIVPEHATSGSSSLRCDFSEMRYPGIGFHDFPRDVASFRSISVDIFNNADQSVNLVVRIDDAESGDQHENRYNGSFMLQPGENKLAIPMESIRNGPVGRKLDLTDIRRFLIFIYKAPGPVTLYIDRIAIQ